MLPLAMHKAQPMTDNSAQDGKKESRDTVAGCRDHAAHDASSAAAADTANGRSKFERSAASWTARADLIESLESGSAVQRLSDRELWDSEEEPEAGPDEGSSQP